MGKKRLKLFLLHVRSLLKLFLTCILMCFYEFLKDLKTNLDVLVYTLRMRWAILSYLWRRSHPLVQVACIAIAIFWLLKMAIARIS